MKSKFRQQRKASGSVLELVGTMFTLALAAIIAVNIGVLLFAAWRNDSTCRDACRAASQRPDAANAMKAAILVTKQFETQGGAFGNPILVVGPNTFQYETFPDADGKPQMNLGPYCRITTRMDTKLLAPVIFDGVKFTDSITFSQSYAFPLLNPKHDDDGDDAIDDALFTGDETAVEGEDPAADTDGDDEEVEDPPADPAPTET